MFDPHGLSAIMKLNCDEPLPSVAFNSNLHHYAMVTTADIECSNGVIHVIDTVILPVVAKVGRCRLTLSNPS
jgi:hypothetical protein